MRSEAGAAWEGGCARRTAVLRSVCPRPDTAVILYVFSVRGREGTFPSGGGRGAVRACRSKGPLLYRISLTPTSCGGFEGILRKTWFPQNSAARPPAILAARNTLLCAAHRRPAVSMSAPRHRRHSLRFFRQGTRRGAVRACRAKGPPPSPTTPPASPIEPQRGGDGLGMGHNGPKYEEEVAFGVTFTLNAANAQ